MSNQRAGFNLEGKGAFLYGLIFFVSGLLLGYAYAVAVEAAPEDPKIEREALQLEYDAYRLCMQSATSCSMQPSHFIRFYELKRDLESDQ